MFATDISFGQQLQYNAITKAPLEKTFEGKLVNMVHTGDTLFIKLDNNEKAGNLIELEMPESSLQQVLYDLKYYKDACLIRVDKITNRTILFTRMIFSKTVHFHENEALKLIINKAIEFDLRKYSIRKNPIDFFTEEFLIDDICFIRGEENSDKISLIGTQYMCVFQRNKQNILQAIEITRVFNRAAIFGNILVFKGNISFQDNLNHAQLSHEANRKYEESLKDTQELLKLWNLYSQLETEAAKEQIEEIGSLKYTSTYSTSGDNNRLRQVFYLDKKPSAAFLQSDIGYAVATIQDFNQDDITSSKTYFIGTHAILEKKRQGDQYELAIELEDDDVSIPATGYLLGSFAGSKVMAKRREIALNKILDGKTPLVNLKNILQTGNGEEIVIKDRKNVTDELSRRIFGTKNISFTERQKEAIGIAINTPDIAIIQGPPGTGKTTVIRAIIARLNMIHNGNISILVSSAQHDAVDNAIENVEYGGLPVNRIGGKKANQSKLPEQSMFKWIAEISNNCDEVLTHEENGQERAIIREILIIQQKLLQQKGELHEVHKLLTELYPLLKKISIEESIIAQMEMLLSKISGVGQRNTLVPDDNSVPEIVTLLGKQRVSFDSYMDDGRNQLSQLIRFVRTTIDIELEVPRVWNELRLAIDDDEIRELLPAFKESIDLCLEQFEVSSESQLDEDLLELDIEAFLSDLRNCFEIRFNEGVKTLSDILWDFRDQLENPTKVSELIRKYTNINAATCQQSVLKTFSGLKLNSKDEYDYVIVDEAARANPLDLLIPMSLGKHIILVGDHKQLPHLLEENVVKSLLEQKNDPEIRGLLNEPLFSRLFTMLEKTKFSSHKRTVMLVDQYRMHPKIAKFVSDSFYDQKLLSTHVTEKQKAHHLERYKYSPIAWVDVPQGFGKEFSVNGQSKSRKCEVDKVMQEVNYILDENSEYSIGIITFYKKQAIDLQNEIDKLSLQDQGRIEVGTVDSFQGKEFDVVILSTVRSNNLKDKRKRVGFLDSRNRLNVAFSRGKRLLVVVGDAETVALNEGQIIIQELHDFYQLCRKEGYCEQTLVHH